MRKIIEATRKRIHEVSLAPSVSEKPMQQLRA
jgi:hypothetical protein